MGQSRHWPNNDLLLGCSLESKHHLAPQATDSTAHLPLTSVAMKRLYCLLWYSFPFLLNVHFYVPQKQNASQDRNRGGQKYRYSASTTTYSTSTWAESPFAWHSNNSVLFSRHIKYFLVWISIHQEIVMRKLVHAVWQYVKVSITTCQKKTGTDDTGHSYYQRTLAYSVCTVGLQLNIVFIID